MKTILNCFLFSLDYYKYKVDEEKKEPMRFSNHTRVGHKSGMAIRSLDPAVFV